MHPGKRVFAQSMDFIPGHDFWRCVNRYHGDYKVSSFSCWDQFLCIVFAQLTYRESLRDIETCLRVLGSHLYHLRIRGHVARSTLADGFLPGGARPAASGVETFRWSVPT